MTPSTTWLYRGVKMLWKLVMTCFLSFLATGFDQRQVRSGGIFDDEILTHESGSLTIFEALRDYVVASSPLHQEVEGRFYVKATEEDRE
jgi:hypothetical protein